MQDSSILLVVAAVFIAALNRGTGEARALTFTTLIIANIGLILTSRSWSRTTLKTLERPNPALWWVLAGAVFSLGLVLYLPPLRDRFLFTTLHFDDLVICLAAGVISIVGLEVIKRLQRCL